MRDGWKSFKISDVAEIVNGGTPKTGIKNFWDGNIPWITPADLGKLKNREVASTPRTISKLGLDKSSAKMFPEDSIILSTRAPIGHLAINKVPMSTNQGCRGIVPSANLDTVYLYYFLSANIDLLNELGTGATFRELSTKALASVNIPVPPLQEQQQIVAILDEAFGTIDQAKANIEKNIQNAKELFQSKLNEIFSQKDDGWESDKLANLTTKIGSGATPSGGQASYKKEGISLIRSMNVHDNGFRPRNLAFIDDKQAKKLDNVTLEEGDVLLNITGASVARCCKIPNDYLPARVNQHVSIIRPIKEKLDSDFLHYILTSKITKDKLLGIGEQGATRQAITKAQIETFEISYPISIDAQRKTMQELNEVREKAERLAFSYQEKNSRLDELKKSILQKAFAGELKLEKVNVA